MDLSIFREIGLSENEISIYLASLEIGVSTTSDIANKVKLARTTTYSILKSLKDKGFMGYVIKSGVKYFNAIPPKEILEKLKDREKRLKDLMPELENLQKIQIRRPKVEFYEGIEGFKTVANNMLGEPIKEYCAFIAENNLEFLPHFHLQYRRKRRERKIHVKVITEKSNVTEDMKKKDKEELRETRFLDKIMKDSYTSFFVYGNKVAYIMATEREQLGVIVENKDIANFQKKVFELLWKIAKK